MKAGTYIQSVLDKVTCPHVQDAVNSLYLELTRDERICSTNFIEKEKAQGAR